MILRNIFSKKSKKEPDTPAGGGVTASHGAGATDPAGTDRPPAHGAERRTDTADDEVFLGSGVAADVHLSARTAKKSKAAKTNTALNTHRKRRTRRTVHTKRQYRPKRGGDVKNKVSVYDTIVRPVVTEKAADFSERGVYAFFVRPAATKWSVADAVEAIYGVRPVRVRMATAAPKKKRIRVRGREREYGATSRRKKAYVFLKKGDTIQLT